MRHSFTALSQFERPFLSSASHPGVRDAAVLWKSKEGIYQGWGMQWAAPERSSACSGPHHLHCVHTRVLAHSRAQGKGVMRRECRASSAATSWRALGPRGFSRVPHQNQPCCGISDVSYGRSLHCGFFLTVGIRSLSAVFIF